MTVLGTATPRRILPKGTQMHSPRVLGTVGTAGTPLQAVIRWTSRWWTTPADMDSTRQPG